MKVGIKQLRAYRFIYHATAVPVENSFTVAKTYKKHGCHIKVEQK